MQLPEGTGATKTQEELTQAVAALYGLWNGSKWEPRAYEITADPTGFDTRFCDGCIRVTQ